MDRNAVTFAREFIRQPQVVASFIPSSRNLARRMVAPIPQSGQPVVVELGPGTGAFTEVIQEALAGRGTHIAVELNERFSTMLGQRFPGVDVVTADARNVVSVLHDLGLGHADVVVSGLPWALFVPDRQRSILDGVIGSLCPDGSYTTFAYLHALWTSPARRFRRLLNERFEEVVLGRTVWSNFPPALVYHCRRPRRSFPERRTSTAISSHLAEVAEVVH